MNTAELPPSLWAATAVDAPPSSSLEGSLSVDVVVVGAGFCGLRTAIELASAGVSACVIDVGAIGWGASGRNGGQVNPIGHESPSGVARRWGVAVESERVQRYLRFTIGAADGLFDLVRRLGIECDAEQNGWIRGLHSEAAGREFEGLFDGWQRAGADLRLLERDEIEGLSGTRCYFRGWLAARGGSVQPLSYARGLARAALAAGANIFTDTRGSDLVRSGDRWLLSTDRGKVFADSVVLCTNAYTDGLFPGLRESIVPVVSVQSATGTLTEAQMAEILPKRQTFSDTRRVIFYFRKTADNRLVFGSAGREGDLPGAADRRRLLEGLRTVYPQFPDLDIEYLWGGRIALTLDHLPHIHELAPGIIAGLGCNGRGVAMATAMGAELADWVLHRDADRLALPITRPRRIPLHRFHSIGVRALLGWREMLDRREARSSSPPRNRR
ncbi:MAG: FAD-binding oxidoreductase [Ectothiorhodospiraceae bacterium AqS1]|nr:FAD-binding oxidoreductase [Ectothiorhodospiraceae bacterium AqS1]